MGIFSTDSDPDKEEDDKAGNGGVGLVLFLLAIPFLGSVVIGLLSYGVLLRILKFRLSLSSLILGAIALIATLYIVTTDSFSSFLSVFRDLSTFGQNWPLMFEFLIPVNVIIGTLAGFSIIALEVRRMKTDKSLTQLEGMWQYGFQFRKTPFEIVRKKKLIQALKEGTLRDETKAPLGYDLEKEREAYRYIEEAARMTLVVGAAGSGKALHKDTTIPTPFGKRTVGDLNVGDAIFDETGRHTRIIGKYQPMTEDHYLLTMSDGTEIKACGDHLWQVLDSNTRGDFKKTIGKPIFTDEVLAELGVIANSDDDSLITLMDMKEEFNPNRPGSFRRVLNESNEGTRESSYSRDELLTLLSNEKVKNSEIKSIINYLDESNDLFIYRSELTPFVANNVTLDNMVSKISTKRIQKSITFKKNRAAQILLEKELEYRQVVDRSEQKEIITSTREIFDVYQKPHYKSPYAIKVNTAGVEYEEQDLLVDPYTLGAWLGDGNSRNGNICGADPEAFEEVEKSYSIKRIVHDGRSQGDVVDVVFNKLGSDLRALGLLMNYEDKESLKDIPDEYMYSSRAQRLALISGLLDTDGSVSKDGVISIGLTNKKVIEKAREVVASLGYKPNKITVKIPKVKYNGIVKDGKTAYSFTFMPNEQFFKITRNANRVEDRLERELIQQARHEKRYIVDIKKIEDKPEDYYCFEVDSPNHLFLCTDSYIITHNTISMLSMMLSDIDSGRTVCAVDFKRSPEFAAKLAKWAEERGINFYHFESGSPKGYRIEGSRGQSTYDPFASGSGAEMILGMREYDTASSVYKTNMQQVLQIIFAMMKQADKSKAPNIDWSHGGIYQLASAIDSKNIKDLLNACENRPIYNDAAQLIHAATASQKNNISHSLEELRGQMRTIIASEYGRWFRLDEDNEAMQINLVKLLTQDKQAVILFSFNSEDEPELSESVGSMIFADLRACSGKIRNMKANKVINVYVDEFQAVPPTAVTGLLEKARESKIAMTLAQQSFEQIITSSQSNGEAYLNSILVTCSNFLIHAGMTLDSAERVSNILGKEWVTTYSKTQKNNAFFLALNFGNKRSQVISERKEERWKRDPSDFMALSAPSSSNSYKSEAIFVNKSISDPAYNVDGAISRKLWMIPQSEVLAEYVTPQIGGFEEHDDYSDYETSNSSNSIDRDILKTDEELQIANFDEDFNKIPESYAEEPYFEESEAYDFATPENDYSNSHQSVIDQYDLHKVTNEENDDGGFGFEEIEETSILDTSLDAFSEDFKPKTIEQPTPPRRAAERIKENYKVSHEPALPSLEAIEEPVSNQASPPPPRVAPPRRTNPPQAKRRVVPRRTGIPSLEGIDSPQPPQRKSPPSPRSQNPIKRRGLPDF